MQTNASSRAAKFTRKTLEELSRHIAVLQREHDQLVPLVVEGPAHLRSDRLRELKFVAQRLVAAQEVEARISRSAASFH